MANSLDEAWDDLGHHLKLKFRLPPDRPTRQEVKKIFEEIASIPKEQRTLEVWRLVVLKHVRFTERYVYEGLDNSDLDDLHSQIMMLLD